MNNACNATWFRHQLAQVAVAGKVGHQKVNGNRHAVFAIPQRDGRTPAKQAVVFAQQRAVERAQYLCNALVVRSFKHGRQSRQGLAQGIDQLLLMRLQL